MSLFLQLSEKKEIFKMTSMQKKNTQIKTFILPYCIFYMSSFIL